MASPHHSFAREKCTPRFPFLIDSRYHEVAGTFDVLLDPPEYKTPASVQAHLVFSMMASVLVTREISEKTKDHCYAYVLPRFPNLSIMLRAQRPGNGVPDRQKSLCALALQDVLSNSQWDDAAVNRAADWASRIFRPMSLSPDDMKSGVSTGDAHNILHAALSKIHQQGTPPYMLQQLRIENSHAIAQGDFRGWLQTQRSGHRDELVPGAPDCRPVDAKPADTDDYALRHALDIASPGSIEIARTADGPIPAGPLRYAVIIPSADRDFSSFSGYCHQEHPFLVGDNATSLRDVSVHVRCLNAATDQAGYAWTVIYCDPRHCADAATERAVLQGVLSDPDFILRRNLSGASAGGPYFVTVKP